MLLPGITGDDWFSNTNLEETLWPEYITWFQSKLRSGSEPFSDGMIFEPIQYRSAIKDNCTHIIVLRTRPDGVTVTSSEINWKKTKITSHC